MLLSSFQRQLSAVEIGVVGQNLEIAGGTAVVANAGEAHGIGGCCCFFFLLLAVLSRACIGGEGVRDIAERAGDSLLVGVDELLVFGLNFTIVTAYLAASKIG